MDPLLVLVSIVLIIAVPFDWIAAGAFIGAAMVKPYNWVLTLAALRSTAIAIAATIAAFLAFAGLVFYAAGIRVIPQPWGTVLLAVALVIISLPNIYALAKLRDPGAPE